MTTSSKKFSPLTTGLLVSAILVVSANVYAVQQHQTINTPSVDTASFQSIKELRQNLMNQDV